MNYGFYKILNSMTFIMATDFKRLLFDSDVYKIKLLIFRQN